MSQLQNHVSNDARLVEVLDAYLAALETGTAPSHEALLAQHPELAGELEACLASLQFIQRAAVKPGPLDAPSASVPAGDVTARVLGDFRIVREVGRGGMGIVYEVEQISLCRRVALKVLPFASTLDARQLQRFKNEAHAAAGLHHTNIVPVYATGCERGVHFYAMQFVEGQTLAQVIAALKLQASEGQKRDDGSGTPHLQQGEAQEKIREPQPATCDSTVVALATVRSTRTSDYFRTVAKLGVQAAEALEYAHQLGVIHRDIKPANLLIEHLPLAPCPLPFHVWITDFGLARTTADQGLTITGDVLGTLRYMSPEQSLGQRGVVDHRTDIYAVGVTLYELMTLRPAFAGTDRQALLRQIAFDEPRPPRKIDAAIPMELETIVLKAMEKSPADRYATAQALADDLRRYLLHEPIRARRASLLQRARKAARRHPGVSVTAAVATFIGLLLGLAGLAANNWMVRQEQLRTGDALRQAQREKAVAEAVRSFLRDKLLAQAAPRAQADALRASGNRASAPKPTLTVRALLDRAALELTQDQIETQFPGQPLTQAEILATIGEAYRGIGEYEAALAHLGRARDLFLRELGPDDPGTLATIDSLAATYLDDGKAAEAARLFEQTRDLRSEKLGPDHPDTLDSMNNLARCYFALRRHADALRLREEIVKLRKAKLGPDNPDTLASMNNLANSYAAAHQFGKALQLHKETLALRQAKLGSDDPDTLDSMNNIANCYAVLGRHAEALKLHQETLERRRATLGPVHRDTLRSMNNVAVTCSALGRHAEALKWHERTLALRKAKLPLDHPDTLISMNAVAWLLANSPERTLRDPERALALAKQAVDRAPDEGDYWNTLGSACYRTSDWNGAVRALTKSMQLRHGGDATDWFFFAMARWHLGDKNESRKWYTQAVQWMDKHHAQDEELRTFRAEAAELLQVPKN